MVNLLQCVVCVGTWSCRMSGTPRTIFKLRASVPEWDRLLSSRKRCFDSEMDCDCNAEDVA